jgi:hypothetical protein
MAQTQVIMTRTGILGRKGYVGREFAGIEIALVETLEGLEARVGNQCIGVLREYRDLQHLYPWEREKLPSILPFEAQKRAICPRMAVA